MKIRRTLIGLAAVAAALGTFTTAATAQAAYKAEYRMSLVLGPPTPWGQAGKVWSDLVKERTQGRINMKLYPGVSLIQGDQTREFSALRQGVIDMAVGSTINWSPQVKELNLFSLPFLMPDYAAIDALTQGEVGKKIFATLDKGGVVPLAWGENGYRELTNSKRPIKSPEDLKGMKIRVVGSPLFSDMFTALGANPTQMSWADAQPALSSGAVDGQENPLFLFTIRQDAHRGPEVRHHLGLRGRSADLRGQQGHLEQLDTGRPEDRARGRDRSRQAGDRHRPQRPGRGRQALAEGHRRHGRDRDRADPRRA
jgi:tripartite ATP-independent transporter DctP family solute receptor